jgi:hypothetical protein
MDKSILVSGPLVKPIQIGLKTETRRTSGLDLVNENPDDWTVVKENHEDDFFFFSKSEEDLMHRIKCPYGEPGDLLWVRENCYFGKGYDGVPPREIPQFVKFGYAADGPKPDWAGKTRPSIHMPRWVSRISLKLLSVNVERVQDITEVAARLEGVKRGIFLMGTNTEKAEFGLELNYHGSYRDGFRFTICKLNGLEIWDHNYWVWVLKFKLHKL